MILRISANRRELQLDGTSAEGGPGLRILMLSDDLNRSGLQRVVVSLTTGLARRGHVLTVGAEPGGELWEELPAPVNRLPFPARRSFAQQLRFFWWLVRVVRSGRYDIVHAHQRALGLQARVASVGARARVVEHVHSTFQPGLTRALSFRGHSLIACGPTVAAMLEHQFGRQQARISTVPNVVADWPAALRQEPPAARTGSRPRLLVAGRVAPEKDPQRFIDVVADLNRDYDVVDASWVGDGELLDASRAAVAANAVRGVEFVGAREDIADALAACDVFVLTSRQEGLPLVLLEAAAMGRALIAPDVGSCSSVVHHGYNGYLYPQDASPAHIAGLVRELLEPTRIGELGAASRAVFEAWPGLEHQLTQVEAVHRRTLGAGSPDRVAG